MTLLLTPPKKKKYKYIHNVYKNTLKKILIIIQAEFLKLT